MKKLAAIVLFAGTFGSSLFARNHFSPFENAFTPTEPVRCLSHGGAIPDVEANSMIEFGFDLPGSLDPMIGTEKGMLNPFDPDQVNVVAEFKHGSDIDTVYGFYYKEYIRDPATVKAVYENCPEAKWIEQRGQYKWHVRFTPPLTGSWTAEIKVYFPSTWPVPQVYSPLAFEVVNSSNEGFLAIGNDHTHFLTTGNQKSFFCIGQDIAWTDGTRFRGASNTVYPKMFAGGFADVQDWIGNLAENGGNMVRVVNVPWTYELEWDTVGRYRMDRAWELDSLFSVCEQNNVKLMFCLEHGTYTLYPWYEEHLTWDKHPYHRFLPGVKMPDDFLTDSTARGFFKKKLRYFLARWGYSSSLGVFEILSEMDNWTFRAPDVKMKNNRGVQKAMLAWHNEMLSFAKKQVSYRPLLTSTSYGGPPRDFAVNAFSSPYVDVVCPRHCYFTERNDNLRRFEEINGVSLFEPGVHNLFPRKPVMIDEMGMGALGADPGDVDAVSDVVFHNSIWATSFSGLAGAGLYWWSWSNNAYREQNFPALHAFYENVDFEKYAFTKPGHWEDASRTSKVSIETFYNVSADAKHSACIGWVHNASYWWGNVAQNEKDRNGKMMIINSKTGDDETISAPTELEAGTVFEIHDLAGNTEYNITWYSTRQAGGEVSSEKIRTNIFGTAKIVWPGKTGDWAYKMVRE